MLDYFNHDGYVLAKDIHVPVLIISAGKDETVAKPFEHKIFARRFPNATQITIAGSKHSMHGHEAEVANIISEWVK